MQAVFLDRATFGNDVSFEELNSLALNWQYFETTLESEVEARTQNADLIVTNKVLLTRKTLAGTKAKAIFITATGTNNVDLEAAKEFNIAVFNVPGYSTPSVVQLTFTFILMLSESLPFYLKDVENGRWQKSETFTFLDYPFEEIEGKNLGIIGYGAIGKELALKAKAFGMEVLIAESLNSKEKKEGRLPLEEVLKRSDFISVHVPLTEQTKNLIGEKELSMMKQASCLINVSRGGVVNEEALSRALQNKTIRAAALDVLTKEPPNDAHPLLNPKPPNLILTPHIAWASVQARRRALHIVFKNIKKFQGLG